MALPLSQPSPIQETSPLQVEVEVDIGAIPPAVWDSLLEDGDLQATHRFVSLCQSSNVEGAEYRHVLVRLHGELHAVATFCAFRVGLDTLTTGVWRTGIENLRRVKPGLFRVKVVFCGLPVSFGKSCLRFAREADHELIVGELARVAERFASEVGADLICFKEFTEAETESLASLATHGYFRAPSLPGCRLEVRWRTFDDYVSAMRSPYRRQLLATLQAGHEASLNVEVISDFLPECPALFSQYRDVMRRAQFRLEHLNLTFFENLTRLPAGECSAILVRQRGDLVASAVIFESATETTFLLVGMDYGGLREHHGYHVVVTEVIRRAIERGARAVELGQTSYDLKGRLGGVTSNRSLFVRSPSRSRNAILRAARRILFPSIEVKPRRVFRNQTGSPAHGDA